MKEHANDIFKKFTGDQPFPVNVTVTVSGDYLTRDNQVITITQNSIPLDSLSPNLQKVIRYLEMEALASPELPFRETAAFIFLYSDGSAEAKCFTSDIAYHVNSDVHFDAIDESRILDELDAERLPKVIFHIHMHPGMEYKPAEKKHASVLINDKDFRGYQQLSAFFSAYAGKVIPIIGLVKPVGRYCDNVIFETEAFPHDPDNKMLTQAMVKKGLRASKKIQTNLDK